MSQIGPIPYGPAGADCPRHYRTREGARRMLQHIRSRDLPHVFTAAARCAEHAPGLAQALHRTGLALEALSGTLEGMTHYLPPAAPRRKGR